MGAKFAPGVILILLTIGFFVVLIRQLLTDPVVQGNAIAAIAVLAFLWWVYMQLPGFIRQGFKRLSKRSKGGGGGHGH